MISNVKEANVKPHAIGNLLINHLQEVLTQLEDRSADCLILTHRANDLVQRFEPVMRKLSALHLPLAQDEWAFDESDLAAAVSWSIREAGISEIYICGHSQAFENSLPAVDESESSDSNERSSMLSRVLDNQHQLQHAKNCFAQQVSELCGIPEVEDALKNASVRIYPLFFLAQAGTFMSYDPAHNEFHPLVPNEMSM